MLDLSEDDRRSPAPLQLFCDFKAMRGQSGKAAVANLKKLSVIRAEWNATSVQDSLHSPIARAAFEFLMCHNEAYASYVREHAQLVAASFPKGRKTPTCALLMKMPGVEAAARPWLYPQSGFNDTDLRERLRELGLSGPGQQLSVRSSFLR